MRSYWKWFVHLVRRCPIQERRNLLAQFGLTGDVAHQIVRSLSGGQRNRACLARVAADQANFLVLDEPMNHLDLWARDSLERCLKQFDGTILFVSHDRYFLNRVVDHLLVVEANRFRIIEGNYDTYLNLIQAATNEEVQSYKAAEQAMGKPRQI